MLTIAFELCCYLFSFMASLGMILEEKERKKETQSTSCTFYPVFELQYHHHGT